MTKEKKEPATTDKNAPKSQRRPKKLPTEKTGTSYPLAERIDPTLSTAERNEIQRQNKNERVLRMQKYADNVQNDLRLLNDAIDLHRRLTTNEQPNPADIETTRLDMVDLCDRIEGTQRAMYSQLHFDALVDMATTRNPSIRAKYADAASKIKLVPLVIPEAVASRRKKGARSTTADLR